MGKLLEAAIENAPNRRGFLAKTGLFGAATLAAVGLRNLEGQSTAAPTDADILNFALNLEYLEAEFYTVATTGMTIDKMGVGITGSGAAGATTGGAKVNFSSNANAPLAAAIASEIAYDERAHVAYIRAALTAAGATPIAKPAINLMRSCSGLAESLTFSNWRASSKTSASPLMREPRRLSPAKQSSERLRVSRKPKPSTWRTSGFKSLS